MTYLQNWGMEVDCKALCVMRKKKLPALFGNATFLKGFIYLLDGERERARVHKQAER